MAEKEKGVESEFMKKVSISRGRELEPLTEEKSWIHGIPTAEDVTDPEYQEQRRIEKFNTKIDGVVSSFRNTSTVWLHNRVVAGLRRFGKDVTETEHFLEKGGMDKRVVELVDPDFVFGVANSKLERFVALVGGLGENSHLLDYWRTPMTVTSKVEMVFENGLISQEESGGSFSYTYIPAEVLVGIVGKMRSRLEQISDMVGEEKLLAVYDLFERLDDDSAFRLVGEDLEYRTGRSCFGMEHREDSEAWKLRERNWEITGESDVFVRFDAKCLVMKMSLGERSIPLSSMLEGETGERYKLSQRVSARDCLNELTIRGEVMVNGRKLKRINGLWRYEGLGVPTWLVNVLGEAVESEAGVVEPEDWVIFERELVAEYRRLPMGELLKEKRISRVILDLLEKYHESDEEEKLLTLRDRLERLVYGLRQSEYDRICRR